MVGWSLLILKNPKKAAKLGNAPNDNNIHRLPDSLYNLKVC